MDEKIKQCENEVKAVLDKYGLQMIVCQRLIDGQLVPLKAPLSIVFIPGPILGEPVTIADMSSPSVNSGE